MALSMVSPADQHGPQQSSIALAEQGSMAATEHVVQPSEEQGSMVPSIAARSQHSSTTPALHHGPAEIASIKLQCRKSHIF